MAATVGSGSFGLAETGVSDDPAVKGTGFSTIHAAVGDWSPGRTAVGNSMASETKAERIEVALLDHNASSISLTGLEHSLLGQDWRIPAPHDFREQGGPGLGPGGLGGGVPGQSAAGSGLMGLRIIPVITLAERYDSNVFSAPKIAGLRREDYVTTASPQIFLQDTGRFVTTTLTAGAAAEYYAVHPQLSYVGFNAGATLNLTALVRTVLPNLSLYVSDGYRYTPNPPTFLTGHEQVQQNQVAGDQITSQLPASDTFIRGLQASRVNQKSNTASVAGAYVINDKMYAQASYGYSTVNFGVPALAGTPGFSQSIFDSTTHTVNAGPSYKVTAQDTVTLNYNYVKAEYSGGAGGFETHVGTLGWARTLSSSLIGRIYGGASVVRQDPGQVVSTTTAGGQQLAYSGGASLAWSVRRTQASLTYSTGVYPGYVNGATALLSHNVSLFASHRLEDRVIVAGAINYARNDALGPAPAGTTSGLSFESYSTLESLTYRISPSMFTSLSHTWGYFTGDYNVTGGGAIIRNTVTISLTSYWY